VNGYSLSASLMIGGFDAREKVLQFRYRASCVFFSHASFGDRTHTLSLSLSLSLSCSASCPLFASLSHACDDRVICLRLCRPVKSRRLYLHVQTTSSRREVSQSSSPPTLNCSDPSTPMVDEMCTCVCVCVCVCVCGVFRILYALWLFLSRVPHLVT
jgi:hypothetical protein